MAVYTVKRTDTGYQPMRNDRPHFEEYPDYLSAHLACKVAENRQAKRSRKPHAQVRPMTQAIDIAALRSALAHSENMVEYYGQAEKKRAENDAMRAAGLKPLHSESMFKWDLENRDRFARQAEALKAVIAALEASPELFNPTRKAA